MKSVYYKWMLNVCVVLLILNGLAYILGWVHGTSEKYVSAALWVCLMLLVYLQGKNKSH